VKLLFLPDMSAGTIGIVGAGGLAAGAFTPKAARRDKPVTHTIPWDRITKVKQDPQAKGAAILLVKRHAPQGPIHFRPADLDVFLSAASDRVRALVK
jgi:hypothetical protein